MFNSNISKFTFDMNIGLGLQFYSDSTFEQTDGECYTEDFKNALKR